jgi:hypothetical protein
MKGYNIATSDESDVSAPEYHRNADLARVEPITDGLSISHNELISENV